MALERNETPEFLEKNGRASVMALIWAVSHEKDGKKSIEKDFWMDNLDTIEKKTLNTIDLL